MGVALCPHKPNALRGLKMQKSIVTKYYVMSLIYKHWLRDILIKQIKTEKYYENLLSLCDTILLNEVDERRGKWEY